MFALIAAVVVAAPPFVGTIQYVDAEDHPVVIATIGPNTIAIVQGDGRVYVDEKGQRFVQMKPGSPVHPEPPQPKGPTLTSTTLADRTLAGRTAKCRRFRLPNDITADAVDVCVFPDARDAIDIDGGSKDIAADFAKEGIHGLLASVTLRSGDVIKSEFKARALNRGAPPPAKDAFFYVAPLKP